MQVTKQLKTEFNQYSIFRNRFLDVHFRNLYLKIANLSVGPLCIFFFFFFKYFAWCSHRSLHLFFPYLHAKGIMRKAVIN